MQTLGWHVEVQVQQNAAPLSVVDFVAVAKLQPDEFGIGNCVDDQRCHFCVAASCCHVKCIVPGTFLENRGHVPAADQVAGVLPNLPYDLENNVLCVYFQNLYDLKFR